MAGFVAQHSSKLGCRIAAHNIHQKWLRLFMQEPEPVMASLAAARGLYSLVHLPYTSYHRSNKDITLRLGYEVANGAEILLRPSMAGYVKRSSMRIICSAANKPNPSTEISSTARIRSEVLSPFRSVRMFFYLAFIASAGLGGLIATTQLIGALSNPLRASQVPEILKGLGIDLGAVAVFAFLYSRDNNAKNAQLARLSREESLSNLKLRVSEKKSLSVNSLRGIARLVICAGPESYILESFKRSEPFTESLLERGVLVVPLVTDGSSPSFEFDDDKEMESITLKRKRLWQLVPMFVNEWSAWLEEQKKSAAVPPESPVYLSLRLDGRVRGSGVGYPPWNAFVAQLPPIKGMWSGLFDGMDGRI